MSGCPDRATWGDLDRLDRAGRDLALRHALGCAACRETLRSGDPSGLFALLALRPVPVRTLDEVSSRVATAVATEGAATEPARSRRAIWAGWAAALLLAVVVAQTLSVPVRFPTGDELQEDRASAIPAATTPRAGVEVLSSPGTAHVVDLAVGETQVVMIFDEGLDL